MSYILDALRKSETEHSRDVPPSLSTTAPAIASPRRGLTMALVAVIAVNMVLVALWITGWQPWAAPASVPFSLLSDAPLAPPEATATAVTTVPAAAQPVVATVPDVDAANATLPPAAAERAIPVANTMPVLDVSTHIYSEDPALSAVTINGKRRVVGDVIAPDTQLIEVTETGVVVDYRGEQVAIDVLQDWR